MRRWVRSHDARSSNGKVDAPVQQSFGRRALLTRACRVDSPHLDGKRIRLTRVVHAPSEEETRRLGASLRDHGLSMWKISYQKTIGRIMDGDSGPALVYLVSCRPVRPRHAGMES